MTEAWRTKAHKMIATAAMQAYNDANTAKNGKAYKKHHAYTLPQWVNDLVTCLGNDDEEGAKNIFINEYMRDF